MAVLLKEVVSKSSGDIGPYRLKKRKLNDDLAWLWKIRIIHGLVI